MRRTHVIRALCATAIVAAINSTSGPTTALIRRGASRLRKSPIAIPMGPPISSAIVDVTAVP